MADVHSLAEYRSLILQTYGAAFYRERRFLTPDEWNRITGSGHRGWGLSERNPTLDDLLRNRTMVILGEPGSGKTSIARAAMVAAIQRDWIPEFFRLSNYQGSLAGARETSPPEISDSSRVRLCVLDGFDEVPEPYAEQLASEIAGLEAANPTARFVLTSRQAFFVNRQSLFSRTWPMFYVDDLSLADIDAFAAAVGVSRTEFRTALSAAGLYGEAHNPLILRALLEAFKANGRLPPTKAEAIRELVEVALGSRPSAQPNRRRRSLRMLAVAMETYARNELTLAQAVQVLTRSNRGLTADEAHRLIEELTQSILLQTPRGISFQMRSFGEYLAAEELADNPEPRRILSLMLIGDQQVLGDSWSNCITFLAEMQGAFRRLMASHFPEWIIGASPAAFSEKERAAIVRNVLDGLAARREYLYYHPTIRAHRIAPLVTMANVEELRVDLQSHDDTRVANAALLLGVAQDRESADRIFSLAINPDRSQPVHQSALGGLENVGNSSMVPTLLAAHDRRSFSLPVAVALMNTSQFAAVLAEVAKSDRTVSSVWERLEAFDHSDDVLAVLHSLSAIDLADGQSDIRGYLASVWRAAARLWRGDFAEPVANLAIRAIQRAGSASGDDLVEALVELPDQGDQVGDALVKHLLGTPTLVKQIDPSLFRLVGPRIAGALKDRGDSTDLVSYLRAFGRGAVRQMLAPPVDQRGSEPPEVTEFVRQERERERAVARRVGIALAASTGREVLVALDRLDDKKWPELSATQVGAATAEIESELVRCDLRNRIVWTGPSSWTTPRPLGFLIAVLDRYACRLVEDRPLVWALMAHENEPVLRYYHRHGLTDTALNEAKQLIDDELLHDEVRYGVLRFLRDAGIGDGDVVRSSAAIVQSSSSAILRECALEIVLKCESDNDAIARLAVRLSPELRERAERALLRRGHRPTTERRLKVLLDDPAQLAVGNVDYQLQNPLDWVGDIRLPAVWDKLAVLRAHALRAELGSVVDLITGALGRIDMLRLADVITEQVVLAPAEWQAIQRVRARECRRDGAIAAAQATPFETVIARMRRATTLDVFKIWAEGPSDVLPIQLLVSTLPDDVVDHIVMAPLNGWTNVLADAWSAEPLWHGCQDLAVILDGDRARDYTHPGFPLKEEPKVMAALEKMRKALIKPTILWRYGFENYFPRAAFEAVVGKQVASAFPLDEARPVLKQIEGYSKGMNEKLAEHTSLDDLAGTDLGAFLDGVHATVASWG